jgi:hypothetical protein
MNDVYGRRDSLSSPLSSGVAVLRDVIVSVNAIVIGRNRGELRRLTTSACSKGLHSRLPPSSCASVYCSPSNSVFRLLTLTILQIFSLTSIVDAKVFSTQMSQRVVETINGRLRGILVELPIEGRPSVDAYLGIEYGSLHSGELRFLPPTSPTTRPWTGIRTAMKFKPVCPQPMPDFEELQRTAPDFVIEHLKRIVPFIERQQEDCLYLNVYVPAPG